MKYVALAFVLSLVILQISAQGKMNANTQQAKRNMIMSRLAQARAGKSGGLFGGSLMPLMLMGGGSDNLRSFMMYRMLMGGGADATGGAAGSTSNMFLPMLLMEGGIF